MAGGSHFHYLLRNVKLISAVKPNRTKTLCMWRNPFTGNCWMYIYVQKSVLWANLIISTSTSVGCESIRTFEGDVFFLCGHDDCCWSLHVSGRRSSKGLITSALEWQETRIICNWSGHPPPVSWNPLASSRSTRKRCWVVFWFGHWIHWNVMRSPQLHDYRKQPPHPHPKKKKKNLSVLPPKLASEKCCPKSPPKE